MDRQYVFAVDDGHGWLVVPLDEVVESGAIHEISHYSYVRRNKETNKIELWLEEDCDAPAFLNCATKLGWNVKHTEDHTDGSHIIREYPRFSYKQYKIGGYGG